jgi:hypothetical protein
VTALDLAHVRAGMRAYHPLADFNSDGRVTAADYAFARARLFTTLPPPPVAPAAQPTRRAAPPRRSILAAPPAQPTVLPQ